MKILLVEDDLKLSKNLKTALERESYVVDPALSIKAALAKFYDNEYSIIILDINLPDGNGFEFCTQIREDGFKTPILMLTARDSIDDRVNGLSVGADDYLIKPFSTAELFARLKALIRRTSNNSTNIINSNDFYLDMDKKLVKVKEKEVDLSSKEYALLEYLALNKGKIISKTEILNHVWETDIDIETNVVDVYIGYLRKKIGKEIIKTSRGMGYKIS
ncbi:response regulator transcription factor [bacterium]|nr:response regulator transcription factor [bacterium]